MTSVTTNKTVGQWVAEKPKLARVFESLGIDYCCGGKRLLAQACEEAGLSPQTVERMLDATTGHEEAEADRNWSAAGMGELIDHILATHHEYLRRELPRLSEWAAKVEEKHSAAHPELHEVRQVYEALREELESHMMKEEQMLFPMIRQLEGASERPSFHCGSVGNPIRVMEHEHDNAGGALLRLHKLTADFRPPADACNGYRALLTGLAEMEADLHQHIHKENNILFPRAMEAEMAMVAAV